MPGSELVHRFMYEHVSGESLQEITIDHACGNRACINPAHLRLLDRKLNLELGDYRKLYSHQFVARVRWICLMTMLGGVH